MMTLLSFTDMNPPDVGRAAQDVEDMAEHPGATGTLIADPVSVILLRLPRRLGPFRPAFQPLISWPPSEPVATQAEAEESSRLPYAPPSFSRDSLQARRSRSSSNSSSVFGWRRAATVSSNSRLASAV